MISDLYDTLVEVFKRYKCPAVIFLGEQYLYQNTETLRVVMWQSDDTFAPQTASVVLPIQSHLYINPRPVSTRRCGFQAQLWATAPMQRDPQDQYRADTAYLDALVNQMCVALQACASGIHYIQGGVAAKGNANALSAGLGYDMTCAVDVPIIDAEWPKQALGSCTKTWHHQAAKAAITIKGKVDPEPPYYQTGAQFEAPTDEDPEE